MQTPNIGLETTILGIGPNAEDTIAENMRKIDAALGGELPESPLEARLAAIEDRLTALEPEPGV